MMFVCLKKDRWVPHRCPDCGSDCGIGHPVTQMHGTRLFGNGFDAKPPATGPGLDQRQDWNGNR